MNCKPGDLVVIVRTGTNATNCIGAIRRVRKACVGRTRSKPELPAWSYYGKRLRLNDGREITLLHDICLRPLRDNEGEDETLSWVPTKETA